MRILKFLAATFTFCLAAWIAAAQTQSISAGLPSLADLQKLKFVPAAAPNVPGEPSYSDLQAAIRSFSAFHTASPDIAYWKWNELPRTRGFEDSEVYYRAVNAVVFIVAETGPAQGDEVPAVTGAGAILRTDEILTNWHVTREAAEGNYPILVFLKPSQGTEPVESLAYKAHVTFYNPTKDLSLLVFDEHPPYQLAKLGVGEMAGLAVGQNVHVIGHPEGSTWSYSTGVISQIRKDYQASLKEGNADQSFEADVLQLQTAINPGNSGGPVMNDNAEIIGLVSFSKADAENVHFAVAVDEIAGFLQRHLARMAGGTRGAPESPPVNYSTAKLPDGRQVIKLSYPDRTAFLILQQDGTLQGMVADAGNGAVIEAWQPGDKGGFRHWRAAFKDGSKVRATGGKDGLPARFFSK